MKYSLLAWRVITAATATLLAFLVIFVYGAVDYGSGIDWTYEVVVLAYPGVVVLGLIFWRRSIKNRPADSLFRTSAWISFLLPAFLLIGWTSWVAGFSDALTATLLHIVLAAIPCILFVFAYLIIYRSIRFAWVNIAVLGAITVLQLVITQRGRATLGDAFSSVSFDNLIIGILIAVTAAVIALLNYLAIRKVPPYKEAKPKTYRHVTIWWGLASLAMLVAGLSTFGMTARAIQEIGQDASRDWSDKLSVHIKTGDLVTLKTQLEQRRTGLFIAPKALVTAATQGRTEIMVLLLDAGADIEGETIINYQTALTSAAAVGDVQMVQTLLKYQADPDHGGGVYIPEDSRFVWTTPLSAAMIGTNSDAVEALLSAGATPDLTSGDGITALMQAAKRGDIRSAQLLLAAGAHPDQQDHLLGWTALHYAAADRREDVYKALVAAGGDPSLRDERGRAAERLFERGGSPL